MIKNKDLTTTQENVSEDKVIDHLSSEGCNGDRKKEKRFTNE
jgi:hypothetical protein